MSEPIETGDGISLPQSEVLGLLSLGLKEEEELHPDFSVEGRGPILVELSQEAANATALLLTRKFEELAPKAAI